MRGNKVDSHLPLPSLLRCCLQQSLLHYSSRNTDFLIKNSRFVWRTFVGCLQANPVSNNFDHRSYLPGRIAGAVIMGCSGSTSANGDGKLSDFQDPIRFSEIILIFSKILFSVKMIGNHHICVTLLIEIDFVANRVVLWLNGVLKWLNLIGLIFESFCVANECS